ncbi:hypothetical protein AB838_07875 [Rhodobacteraceae bacterium (ex Bugula neritina AB1)]|nr:hypothetical protein AB838_07875 [Rhodobacteraceae bacterium (ex Bugula neritina AB1)]
MHSFNTIAKLIVTPVLVIAVTAGSVMAGPRDHFGGTGQYSAKTGGSEISRQVEQKVQDMSAGTYIYGLAIYAGASLKFKQMRDDPTKIPIGTHVGIKKATVAAGLWASQNN